MIIALGIWYNPFKNHASDNDNHELKTYEAVLNFLERNHFSPKSVNDELSKDIFDNYMDFLDRGNRFLTQENVDQLAAYQNELDDQLLDLELTFFDLSEIIITAAVEKSKVFYEEAINGPINLYQEKDFIADPDERGYAKNDDELMSLWENIITFEVIRKIDDKLKAQEKDEEKKSIDELKDESIEGVKEIFDQYFKRIGELRRSDRFSDYLNAITLTFDPHSSYYSPRDKEDFNINLNGAYEGIGARLRSDGEYLMVTEIIPGGPAWKQKELSENDLILQVQQEDEEDPVDVRGWRQDDVIDLIRGKKGTEVTLTVESQDGIRKNIVIVRDEIKLEEGRLQTMLLDLDGTIDQVGYIKLPKFYFEGPNTPGCAEDMETALDKLKEENVSGVIIDLRNNSGGSLSEVVDMSGLFIEKGPIVQVKSRGKQPYVLRDRDPSISYTGPVVVMVNHFSASASEILAAALQDYDRAIVVGGSSSYGKGTVQRFMQLNRGIVASADNRPLGEVKITTQKFYRINGGSTQQKGVVPDIVLPNAYNYLKIGEKNYENSLDWTEIDAVDYSQTATLDADFEYLRASSEKRVSQHPTFQLIEEKAKMLQEEEEEVLSYPLHIEKYDQFLDAEEEKNKKFDNLLKDSIPGLTVKYLTQDEEYINSEDGRKGRYENLQKSLAKDIYVEEVLNILKNLVDPQ